MRLLCRGGAVLALLGLVSLLAVAWSRSALQDPPPSRFLLDRHGSFLGQLPAPGSSEESGYGYWTADTVPERVAAAIIAIEDRRFYAHPGVDPVAIGRALRERLQGAHRRSGASTLAMQVARMQSPGPRTLWRKGLEATTALIMTARYGRTAILRQYLRLVPFSNGSHGIAHAARWFLDKPVADLSWAEIAFLCAIPQSPAHANPFTPAGRARAIGRGQVILAALAQAGVLSAAEYALSVRQIEDLQLARRLARPEETLHALFHLQRDLQHQPAPNPLIRTSLDLDLHRQMRGLVRSHLEQWRDRGAEQVALVVLDRASREVLVWLGSDGYFHKTAGAIDYTRIRRSPGSTLKPFLYAFGLEQQRIAANTIMADLPDTIWGIENADHQFLGPLLPRQALANSRNVPAAWLVRREGLEEAYQYLYQLGLHQYQQVPGRYGLVLAVGALPTTLERLLVAYGALADDGRMIGLRWHDQQPADDPLPVLSAAVARQITLFLADPVARLPSFPRLGATADGLPVAVKTGTSQGYRDAWAVAWTRRYLVGVWTGRARGTAMRSVTGGQSSALLAQTVLQSLHQQSGDAKQDLAFPAPDGYRQVELCAQTGLRNTGHCAETLSEWFADGQIPEEDDVFVHLKIDVRNALLAGPWTPAAYVAERSFAALPPGLTQWGLAHHLPPPPTAISPLDRPAPHIPAAPSPSAAAEDVPPAAPVFADRPSARPAAGPALVITAPHNGLRMVRNPETPDSAARLSLRVSAAAEIALVQWLVDGHPFPAAPVSPHLPLSWPLVPGSHSFQVITADGQLRSAVVSIRVEE